MQLISPETIFRGNNAWQKSLPKITKLTKSPLILGRGFHTKNLRHKILNDLKKQNLQIAYVGDVVGTGSSRKSAINSLIWHIGEDIPFVPNKKTGGIIIGSKIAPIFFNTAQDSGALPIEADVSHLKTGDVIKIYPYEGIIKKIEKDSNTEELISKFDLYPSTLTDEIQAGGRINL